jgi:tRNA U34 5-methylaminomethyl-2-thiouridine-forming methyltransferase MnmC
LRRSKMGKRQDQTDDQAGSRNESVSHRSTKAKTGRQQTAAVTESQEGCGLTALCTNASISELRERIVESKEITGLR